MYKRVPKKAWMLAAKAAFWARIWFAVSVPVCAWPDRHSCSSSAVGDALQEGTVAVKGFCVKNVSCSPLWDVGKAGNWPICSRGVLERHCQLEVPWCWQSLLQLHKGGFLYPWSLQVLCRHNKLLCAWALFPAHFLAESWFSEGCDNVREVALAVCLCLWGGWWLTLTPSLYFLLPLMPDLVVCLLPFVTESFPRLAQCLISFMQNWMCYSGMK